MDEVNTVILVQMWDNGTITATIETVAALF
jgi:hypothetical protein